MMILKMVTIPMLLKVLDRSGRPWVCALFYALIILTNGLIFELVTSSAGTVMLHFLQAMVEGTVFFYAVYLFDSTPYYWPALVGGLLALLWF